VVDDAAVRFEVRADDEGRCDHQKSGPTSANSSHIVREGGELWVLPADDAWQAAGSEAAAGEFIGRYVHGPADHPRLAVPADTCQLAATFRQFPGEEIDSTRSSFSLGAETTH
jgi:hypothetical protein